MTPFESTELDSLNVSMSLMGGPEPKDDEVEALP